MSRITSGARKALVEERKSQILAAAAKVFAKKGYDRATIADVAREARISEGSIYNYFKSKSDLLVSLPHALVQPAVEMMGAELPHLSAGAANPEAVLNLVAHTMLATVTRNAHIFRIMLSALPTMKQSQRDKYLEQVVNHITAVLDAYFQEQAARGVLRADLDTRVATRAFIGMFFPFVMLQEIFQVGGELFDYERVIAQVIPLFLRGAQAPTKKRA